MDKIRHPYNYMDFFANYESRGKLLQEPQANPTNDPEPTSWFQKINSNVAIQSTMRGLHGRTKKNLKDRALREQILMALWKSWLISAPFARLVLLDMVLTMLTTSRHPHLRFQVEKSMSRHL